MFVSSPPDHGAVGEGQGPDSALEQTPLATSVRHIVRVTTVFAAILQKYRKYCNHKCQQTSDNFTSRLLVSFQ